MPPHGYAFLIGDSRHHARARAYQAKNLVDICLHRFVPRQGALLDEDAGGGIQYEERSGGDVTAQGGMSRMRLTRSLAGATAAAALLLAAGCGKSGGTTHDTGGPMNKDMGMMMVDHPVGGGDGSAPPPPPMMNDGGPMSEGT